MIDITSTASGCRLQRIYTIICLLFVLLKDHMYSMRHNFPLSWYRIPKRPMKKVEKICYTLLQQKCEYAFQI